MSNSPPFPDFDSIHGLDARAWSCSRLQLRMGRASAFAADSRSAASAVDMDCAWVTCLGNWHGRYM
jgi:hypothetical protein